jgi:integrase
MFNGELKQQTLLDEKGRPITDIVKARAARDKMLAPYAIKEQDAIIAVLQTRATRKRDEAQQLVDESNPPLSLADGWNVYHASPHRPDSGDSTLARYHSQYKRFAAWMTKRHPAVVLMRDVTEEMAGQYAADLKSAKYSPNAFNKHTSLLRLMWRTLRREIRGNVNPWQEIKRLQVPKHDNSRRAITPEQFTAILAKAADADLHDLIFTLGWSGQRLVDIVMLKWSSVSFKRQVIELVPRKTARRTGNKVTVPLLPPLAALLEKRRENVAGELVFPELATTYDRDSAIITGWIQAAFEAAGLIPREKRAKLKRAVAVYGAHSLRHYFVTEAMAAGWPMDVIKKITGHTSDAMAQHYQHIDAGLLTRLAGQLNGYQGNAQAIPAALPAGVRARNEQMREIILKVTPRTWKQDKALLLTLLSDSMS